ncbi:YceD family protein [Cyanobacterium sp. IPPAS B-1200]|uniref:YceD family protein n=1 Tax=Cyanobacterium sp. IPPAS B-1200 TaxID=1562720 RepID=UPI0026C48269
MIDESMTVKRMERIYIPQLLKMPQQMDRFTFKENIKGFQTLTPIKGTFAIHHRGGFLEVELTADTILTLKCDRCLKTFNHRLEVDTSEIIWLSDQFEDPDNLPLEREISGDDLCESLPPDGYFEVQEWVYEQLSLALPLRQVCNNEDCEPPTIDESATITDSRWAALTALKSLGQ